MLTEDEAKRIVDAISAERFQPFLDDCGGDDSHQSGRPYRPANLA